MKRVIVVLALTAALTAVLLPCDGAVSGWFQKHAPGGDVRRSLEALQQYGDVGTILIVSAVVFLLDRERRLRLWDLYLASAATGLVCVALKMLVGRPRPQLGAPGTFLWPWGTYPLPAPGHPAVSVAAHAWEVGRHGAQLWSMPSSHTAAAMALSLYLIHVYPRLRPLAVAMVLLVGCGRVITGAHYPTDLIVGAAVGYLVSAPLIRREAGTRLVGRWRGGSGRL
jgi:membrane-associated phospholipid phosphatase